MNAWNIISMIPLEDGGFDIGKFFFKSYRKG